MTAPTPPEQRSRSNRAASTACRDDFSLIGAKRRRRLATVGGLAATAAVLLATPAYAAGDDPPAGGAALDQIAYATGGAAIGLAVLALFVFRHRTGRPSLIGRLADRMEQASGIPGWAILPVAALSVSLLTAVFGMYWDISIHIDKGRDPGPLDPARVGWPAGDRARQCF